MATRQIEPGMVGYLDLILVNNGLAKKAIADKDARLLLQIVAGVCVGIREEGGNNQGPLVRLIQETVGSANGGAWCMAFCQTLIAYCELRGLEPDIATAQALLKGKQHRPKHLTPKNIVEKTSQHFDIAVVEIMSPKRDKSIVVPRQIAMYLLRSELHLSFPKIATELGRKDHTTAIHSVDKVERMLTDDYVTRQHIQEIRESLHA